MFHGSNRNWNKCIFAAIYLWEGDIGRANILKNPSKNFIQTPSTIWWLFSRHVFEIRLNYRKKSWKQKMWVLFKTEPKREKNSKSYRLWVELQQYEVKYHQESF